MQDIFFPVVERPIVWMDKHNNPHPTGRKALVAALNDKPKLINIVKDGYKLIHNSTVMEEVLEATKHYKVDIKTYCDPNLGRSFFDVRFRERSYDIGGYPLQFRSIFWNGYGGASLGCYIGAIYAFCTNGMISGEYETNRRRHTVNAEVSLLRDWINNGMQQYDKQYHHWLEYHKTPITYEQCEEMFKDVDDRRAVEMMRLVVTKYEPQFGLNVWSAYNAMTDVYTHFQNYRLRKTSNDNDGPGTVMFKRLRSAETVVAEFMKKAA